MNTEPIDIVIPWLNPTEKWFSEYKKYCENESPARIRDLNTMQLALRSILKNLPWIRYIWLIVFDEEQHANLDWEELKNDKIKFVYHRDIIPQEFLPNFNSLIAGMYVFNIKNLSQHFLWSNDDMIFNKPISKELFFKDNCCVHKTNSLYSYKPLTGNTYAGILNTTVNFINKEFKKYVLSSDNHIAKPLDKTIIEFLFNKNKNELENSIKNSKIRKIKNIYLLDVAYTFEDIFNLCKYNDYKNVKISVKHLSDKTNINEIKNMFETADIICINDSEELNIKANDIKKLMLELTNRLYF